MPLSPMMKHYVDIKEKYKDAIVFYRLGDFYEMFFEDAVEMSKALELTLTGRDCGQTERAPMCGVPVKALDTYLAKALSLGFKVAICEQLTEPTNNGEIVERDVIRVITPGTVMEESILEEKKNNYIMHLYSQNKKIGIAWADISTGEFYATSFLIKDINSINDLVTMISPAEIIANENAMVLENQLLIAKQKNIAKFSIFKFNFEKINAEKNVFAQFNLHNNFLTEIEMLCAVEGLLKYLSETQKRALNHINKLQVVQNSNFMHLDYQTQKNLELTQNFRDNGKKGTILWLLDKTCTSMGARLLRKFIEQPLQNKQEIDIRLNGVEELFKNLILRESITTELTKISDIERLSGKISYGSATPRDLLSLKHSLKIVPKIKDLLKNANSLALKSVCENLIDISDTLNLLENSIDENAGNVTKDGGFIKSGFNNALDELKNASKDGKNWLNNLETAEQKETKIKGLKIGFNRVFGYYIEVLNSQKDLVPFRYVRKQTLSNCERYVTAELKEIEEKILGSEEKSVKLEQEIFNDILNKLKQVIPSIQQISSYLAHLDFISALSAVATKNNFTKPNVVDFGGDLVIEEGRHPIVEMINSEPFVPNNTHLNNTDAKTMIITGPNMAGKSTYMRQVAVIVLLAHIGSFVPAKNAQIPLTDRIFTRIGATDDLAYGQSTFMVEMTEVANILLGATQNSLVILDEVGRGTSTFDGLSIAWSVMEYVSKNLSCKTLFSTHYHELTELEGILGGVKNYSVSVKEFNNNIIFLRKIVRGGANKSFGIEVASLAGLPNEIVVRAKQILKQLENSDINRENKNNQTVENNSKNNEILHILKDLEIEKISPLEAFGVLSNLKEKVGGKNE